MTRKRRDHSDAPEDLSAEQWNSLSRWATEREPWCRQELEDLVANCLDHHRANGNLMVDWVAACRTWIRNEKLWRARRGTPVQASGRSEKPTGLAAAAHKAARDLGLFGSN